MPSLTGLIVMDSNRQHLKQLFHAAVDLAPPDREAFLRANAGDDTLHREVAELLSAHESAGDFISQPAMFDVGLIENDEVSRDAAVTGQQIGSYKIIRELGRGGMGAVYLAARADESFDKQVALKLIKRGMDSDAIIKRFVMERQILANLDHPNIARLIDGGTTEDGLPYFVLEYVEGTTITRYCDQRNLNTMERLKIFRQVCAAVQFAHQNLIVHRDLKPSNIIVTEDATPKLLDFGIAKLFSSDWSSSIDATATIGRVLTPEYASPEELRGLPVTTSSDVYSLGVVLYELLSGHRPFNFDNRLPEDVARKIATSQPIKPSVVITRLEPARQTDDPEHVPRTPEAIGRTREGNIEKLRRRLVGDLDNILLKALRKEPERRYASVQEFSEDIRRHLEGLPVNASPDTLDYRARKFAQRHKASVLAAAVVIVTLLGATAITTWQARVARRERDKAQQRFSQVRKLANAVLFEYHDGIEKLAGSTPVREKMVKDALEYLDNLSAESSGDPTLQSELAAAYEKVGDVQGNPFGANLGNQDGALASYKKSLAIRQAVLTADSRNSQTRSNLARSYEKVGDILWAKGESAESEANYRRALAITKELSESGKLADPTSFVRLYNHIGETQEQAGDLKGGLESHQHGLKASQDLVAIEPTNAAYQIAVTSAYAKIGDIFFQLDDYKKASEHYQAALPIVQKLLAADPTNTALRRKVGLILARVALAKMNTGELPQSIEYNHQAIQILNDLFAADPNNVQIKYNLADVLGNLAETFGRMGDLSSAEENFREAISRFRELLAANPNFAQVRNHFANSLSDYAGILLKNGNLQRALENYRLALTTFEGATGKSASTKTLAEIYEGIADAQIRLNNHKLRNASEAKTMYQKSLAVWNDLQQRGMLTSDYANRPNEVKQKIEKFEAALRQ
jgi:serine/threonine protein kinase